MKVYLHEIKETEKRLSFTQNEPWLAEATRLADESVEESAHLPRPPGNKSTPETDHRPIEARFNLRKVDSLYLVSGFLNTSLHLLCSRCASEFSFAIDSRFSSMYCKDPVMAGVGYLAPRQGDTSSSPELRPTGRNFGMAKSKSSEELNDELDAAELNEVGSDLDVTYLCDDFIDLAAVTTEQLRFRVPFQPLCREDCKGICPNCGANLNEGKCACSKIKKGSSPFASLSQFRRNS